MSGSGKVEVSVGDRVLMTAGPVVVTAIERHGITARDANGEERSCSWSDLSLQEFADGKVQPVHQSMEPWWSSLDHAAREEALFRLEVVLEILTGYRQGLPELAEPGEPAHPFGPGYGVTLRQRVAAMSRDLQDAFDRRRASDDEQVARRRNPSEATLWNWVAAWRTSGVRGLVDGRRTKGRRGFEVLDPRLIRIVDAEVARFDGSASRVNLQELERRVTVGLKQEGLTDAELPRRLVQQYLSKRYAGLGASTRAHKGSVMRRRRGRSSYPDTHPGHLAVDVTRADGLVWDELHGRPFSVEIITVISVPTRVIVACRVVPRSANAVEVGLALYDAVRPFSMQVEGTQIDDFRWCGMPATLDFSPRPLVAHKPALKTDRSLDGVHVKPGVTPKSIRADNGAIFLSTHLRLVLADMGVDLLTSRVAQPTDNAHVERWHETLQRAYQALPGFKGRNVQERGRYAGEVAYEPLVTARELEQHLHRFIALDYHRNQHDGIKVPGVEGGRFSPLESFDMLSEITGRILLPQHPDLIYSFLPIRWLTPGNAGITYRGLTYDGPVLDELTCLPPRAFRNSDDKVPFFYDPRDRTRLWHRSRVDGRVHELRWRQSHLVDAPLTDVVVQRARQLIRERGGNGALSRRGVMLEIVDAITELTSPPTMDEWRAKLADARLRHDQALRDHEEAAAANDVVFGAKPPDTEHVGKVLAFPETSASPQGGHEAPLVDWDAPLPDYRGAE